MNYELKYNYEATTILTTEDLKNKTNVSIDTMKYSGNFTSDSNSNSFGVNPFVLIEYLIIKNINVGLNFGYQYHSFFLKMSF